MGDLYVWVDGPAQVALFVHDNDTLIVESLLSETVKVRIVVDEGIRSLCDALSDETLFGEPILDWREQSSGEIGFEVAINPYSCRVFCLI
jgi:hypothetical protein